MSMDNITPEPEKSRSKYRTRCSHVMSLIHILILEPVLVLTKLSFNSLSLSLIIQRHAYKGGRNASTHTKKQ